MNQIGTLLLVLVLSSCTTNYLGISVTEGDVSDPSGFQSFEVDAVDLPAFLGPILVSNFSVAMAERGLQPVVEGGEAVVTIRYEQEDLTTAVSHDAFDERIDEGSDTRFVARIVVEVRARNASEVLWSGSIQRLHNIRPGDYMHTGRASVAFLDAFRDMLSSYP
ncbi:MAG: hypothetical protein HOC70_01430 [Gammaproteobacteria bacterium]|nr:hypothetical protein [Gammaproteobacteria bacterium]MBT4491875.1 hypothetical protein [Gammaproteobacteria bacterium]